MTATILFGLGFIAGALLASWAASADRKEAQRRHDDMTALAREEIAQAEQRAANAEHELMVKDNIIATLDQRIRRYKQGQKDRQRQAKDNSNGI